MLLGIAAILIVSVLIAIIITKDLDEIHNRGVADRRRIADDYIRSLKR